MAFRLHVEEFDDDDDHVFLWPGPVCSSSVVAQGVRRDSIAVQMGAAFLEAGDVMELLTVQTTRMKVAVVKYPVCAQLTCANGACYNHSQRCDGLLNCRDASDEANCTNRCNSNQFQCANGECIPKTYLCDHDDDCGDQSDERNCTYPTCSGSYFTCPSGRCIHQSWLCDGDDDCEDNTDETGCELSNRECYPGEWPCPSSGLCIPLEKVCDGREDCTFGEDETNTTAGRNCTGVPSLIFSNGRDLLMGDIHGRSLRTLVHSTNRGIAVGVDYHYQLRRIFYSDTMQDKVFSVDVDGSRVQVVLNVSVDYPVNLAVDWINNKLYVVEGRVNRIDMVDLDGSNRVTLIAESLGIPTGIAVDPTVGYLFFSDWDSLNGEPGLERAFMDGTNRYELVKSKLGWPAGVTVDIVSQRVYWVDSRYDYVETVTYDGLYRKTVIYGGSLIPHPYGLSMFEHYVYYTDWTRMAVMRANKFSESSPQVIFPSPLTPYGVTVYHSLRQPFVRNPCGNNKGGCEQICVLSHRTDNDGLGYRCKCRMGFDLHPDGKHCVALSQFLLFSSQLAIRGIPFNLSTQEDVVLPITHSPSYFVGVDYSAEDETIFFSDTTRDVIYKQKLDGTGRETLAANRVESVEDLAYDWISKNLYWTDPRYRCISVMKLADKSRRAIIQNLNSPRSIVVHPEIG
ncbi:LRP2 protein, partial [Polypterus senegalus]